MLTNLYVRLRTLATDDEGATALEYGVLVVFIVIALIAGVTIFGEALSDFFEGLMPGALS
jgi:pilus assembly protein Flp/PilA